MYALPHTHAYGNIGRQTARCCRCRLCTPLDVYRSLAGRDGMIKVSAMSDDSGEKPPRRLGNKQPTWTAQRDNDDRKVLSTHGTA